MEQERNPNKNAELSMEQNGNMIDGIINNGPRKTVAELEEQSKAGTPISLLELAQAVHREDAEKRRAQQPVRREKSPWLCRPTRMFQCASTSLCACFWK